MSPETLLENLEKMGSIDPKALQKIRQEIDNPVKKVKAKAILNYLVKKQQITEAVAVQLLKGEPVGKTVDEFDVDASEKPDYDTDDLVGSSPKSSPDVQPPRPPAERSEPVDINATLMDEGLFTGDDIVEVQPIHVPSNAENVVPMEVGEDAVVEGVSDLQEFDAGYEDLQSAAGSLKRNIGFTGKRNLKDQWSTKWLYIGFGLLGFLIIIGAVLVVATMGVKAEDQFKAAMESFEKSAFQDAVAKFDEYIEDNPGHKHVPVAKARRVQSILAGAYTSKNWSETITSANTLLPPLLEEEDSEIDIIRDDLAVMLPRSLFEVTESAKKTTDLQGMQDKLKTIDEYKKIIDNPGFIPSSQRRKPTISNNLAKIDDNIRTIEGQINKEKEYRVAINQIRQLGNEGSTEKAFATHTKLTRNYGDLAGREELRNTMLEISVKEQELVKPAAVDLAASNTARPSAIQSSFVLGTRTGNPVEPLQGEIANFLAEGSVYGIDVGDGVIVWRQFVGYQTTTQPQPLNQDSLLVVDQQHHELLLLNKATGEIVWRSEVGEPFLPPSFNDSQIVVTTESGKLIQISPQTGESELSAQLPQTANVNSLVAERDPYIYQPGLSSNLYVISNQDFSCREVYYLGHYRGSIAIPPQFWSGYIVVAVNGGDYCDLYVLRPEQNGLQLKLVQVITRVTSGPVTTPLQKFGRWMLVTADNGEIRILELLPSDDKNPVRKFASDRFENSGGQRAFVLTEGSNLWIASQGISRFRIQRNQGKFSRDDIVDYADVFLTPLQKLDENILHVSRRKGSGMLSASLVDATSLQPIWRTDFGGQLAGPPLVSGTNVVAVSNQGDLFRFTPNSLESNFVDASKRASTIVDDLRFNTMIPLGEDRFACLGPAGREDLLFGTESNEDLKLLRLEPPANQPACRPISIGDDLIIPSAAGQITRINAASGRRVGTPFQPPISPGSKTDWLEPTLIGSTQLAVATGAGEDDQEQGTLYLLNLENRDKIQKLGSYQANGPFKIRLVNSGQQVFGIVQGNNNDQLVRLSIGGELALEQTLELPGRVVDGPWLLESGLLLKMDNDQLLLSGLDLNIQWSMEIPNDQFAGAPENLGSQILLSFRSGNLMVVEPSSGKQVNTYSLGQPIIHQPTRAGEKMYLSGMDGTVHIVDLNQLPDAN